MMLALLSGCQSMDISATDYCLIAGPIYPSRSDTPQTLKQIAAHNAKYEELCGG